MSHTTKPIRSYGCDIFRGKMIFSNEPMLLSTGPYIYPCGFVLLANQIVAALSLAVIEFRQIFIYLCLLRSYSFVCSISLYLLNHRGSYGIIVATTKGSLYFLKSLCLFVWLFLWTNKNNPIASSTILPSILLLLVQSYIQSYRINRSIQLCPFQFITKEAVLCY